MPPYRDLESKSIPSMKAKSMKNTAPRETYRGSHN
jgi:hypothetical protein